MCMRNHFSRNGRNATLVVCLLAMCGLNWSCKDDYVLDDEKPTWLNSSVYQSLQERGNFNTYLELLSDSDVNSTLSRKLQEVLSRTGSKTVFAANDSAWEAFFRHNATLPASDPWHNATSLKNLSLAQKKLLIHTSMLNNAIVMENLASSDGNGTNPQVRGQYMRRYTDVVLTESFMYLPAAEVPYTTNDEETNAHKKLEKKNFDFIVLNSLRNEGTCFQSDDNQISIISRSGQQDYPRKPKQAVASDIIDYLQSLY